MGLLPGVGTAEMLIVGIVALLLFGKRLPDVARNMGKSLAELKKGVAGFQEEFRNVTNDAGRAAGLNTSRSYSSGSSARASESDWSEEPAERPEPVQRDESDEDFSAPKFDLD